MIFSKSFLVPLFVFSSIMLFMLAVYFGVTVQASYRGRVKARLNANTSSNVRSQDELIKIRQGRGLSSEGHYLSNLFPFKELLLQSGSNIGISGLAGVCLASCGTTYLCVHLAGVGGYLAAIAALFGGLGIPISVLRAMRGARRRSFEEQLPEAIDTIVRSLRAGHAVALAVDAAGKSPDPVGPEFRLAAAEMTYGLDLETSMINLYSRVGLPDLALIALAISIQNKTGGNLAEILGNLSRIIRERLKIRRKAYALAAEGRFSAIILSLLPFLLFGVLWMISPNYYKGVLDAPYVKGILGGAVVWMLLGDYIMYRMVRIKV